MDMVSQLMWLIFKQKYDQLEYLPMWQCSHFSMTCLAPTLPTEKSASTTCSGLM